MEHERDRRDAVTAADATGMIAGEELITEAETMLPIRPELPSRELHAALPHGHRAHATIDSLHAQIQAEKPSSADIHSHTGELRALPELEAIVANWWDSPTTQRFISVLGQIGL